MSAIVDWPESFRAQIAAKRAAFGRAIGSADTATIEFFAAYGNDSGESSWASDISCGAERWRHDGAHSRLR